MRNSGGFRNYPEQSTEQIVVLPVIRGTMTPMWFMSLKYDVTAYSGWGNLNALQWRHNECDGVWNHRLKLFVTGLWPVDSPLKGPATRRKFPFDEGNYHSYGKSKVLTTVAKIWKNIYWSDVQVLSFTVISDIYRSSIPNKTTFTK